MSELGQWRGGVTIALALLGLSLSLAYPELGLLVLALGTAAGLLLQREIGPRWARSFGLPVLLAALFLVFNALLALHPDAALGSLPEVLPALLLTLTAVLVASQGREPLALALGLVVPALLALSVGLFIYESTIVGWGELFKLTGLYATAHRNSVAAIFACGLLYSVVGAFIVAGRWRVLYALAALFFFFLGYANNSRGAVLGTLVAVPVIFFRAYPRRVIGATLVLMAGLFVAYHLGVGKSLMLHNGSLENGRDAIWNTFIDRALERPWLGLGSHNFAVDQALRSQHPEIAPLYYPHSIYVDIFYSSGIIGLVFWAGWFAWLGVGSGRHLPATDPALPGLGGALLVFVLVQGLVDQTFYSFGVLGLLVFGCTLFGVRLLAPARGTV